MPNLGMFRQIGKVVAATTKSMTSENKVQVSALAGISKLLNKSASGGGAVKSMAKSTKDITSTLQKALKLVEAQTSVLEGLKPEDLAGDGNGDDETAKELEAAVKKITDENKKQAAELEKLLTDVDKAAKEAGDDKDAGKKIKTATAALEKAVKLIDEQSKLLDEARKALAA